MNCLKGLIGVKNCIDGTSDLNLNQLAGITLENLEKLATRDQKNFRGIFEDIESNAVKRMRSDFTNFLRKKYEIKTLENHFIFDFDVLTDNTDVFAGYKGVLITPPKSQLLGVHINSIKVQSNSIQTRNVLIKEIQTGNETVLSTNLTEGFNEVKINKLFSGSIFVGMQGETTSKEIKVATEKTDTCRCDLIYCDPVKTITNKKIVGGVISTGENPGIVPVFSFQCSYDNIICSNINLFELPLLYAMGIEYNKFLMFTDKLNDLVAFDRDRSEEAMAEYEEQYAHHMKNVTSGVKIRTSDVCVECNQDFVFQYGI